ncbi:Nif3-like dinuclear metal center hexameric protein [Pseudarthrobacter sp. P1]|uniref:Nif3-like dinuclear metal center hexameric protein n=1 Tax=Pseudarthrobacter sp. P1 TaxID=3418418 RepID=UPI003CE94F60
MERVDAVDDDGTQESATAGLKPAGTGDGAAAGTAVAGTVAGTGTAVADTGTGSAGGISSGASAEAALAAEPESADDTESGVAAEPEEGAEPEATPTLAEVLLAAEELWPESLAEEWDKVGLVTGRPRDPVSRIMFAVDPTLEVVSEAIAWGADLLVTHHPLLLKGVNSVAATTGKGQVIHSLIESGCALLTVHTNGDSAVGGVSDVLADALGLVEVEPLMPSALGLPEEGIGRVGQLPTLETLGDFAQRVFEMLPAVASGVRVAGDSTGLVRRVAVCGGAGDGLFDAVRASRADVYVTADLRHHPASEAREGAVNGRPYLVDLSHWASEWLWLPAAAMALENVLTDQGYAVELAVSQTNSDPWDFILTPGLGA